MRGFTRSGPLPSGAATVAEHHVAVGSLVLAGAIAPAEDVDEHALRWRVFVWDLWFLLWGLALALAIVRFRRRRGSPAGTSPRSLGTTRPRRHKPHPNIGQHKPATDAPGPVL